MVRMKSTRGAAQGPEPKTLSTLTQIQRVRQTYLENLATPELGPPRRQIVNCRKARALLLGEQNHVCCGPSGGGLVGRKGGEES